MQRLFIPIALLLASGVALKGQVEVEVLPEQKEYLVGEPIQVGIKITNRSGQRLILGENPHWLDLTVESRVNYSVPEVGDVSAVGRFSVNPSTAKIRWVDISPYFRITKPGRYQVTATVRIFQWGTEVSSQPGAVKVIKGATLWEQKFGVPPSEGQEGFPEVRKYILKQLSLLDEIKLYVQLTDASGSAVYRAMPICQMLSFSDPEAKLDAQSNLHVLCQDGAWSFDYSVVNPAGERIRHESYTFGHGRPRLQRDREGEITVRNGRLLRSAARVSDRHSEQGDWIGLRADQPRIPRLNKSGDR